MPTNRIGRRRPGRDDRCGADRARGRSPSPPAPLPGSRSSVALIAATSWSAPSVDAYSIFAPTRISSGPMCSVRMWISWSTWSLDSIAATIAERMSADADSPISRLFISITSTIAITINNRPMLIEPTASHRASSVVCAITTPPSARSNPVSAPTSSNSTTGSSGCFVPPDEAPPTRAGLTDVVRLLHRRAQRERLQHDRHEQDPDRNAEALHLVRIAELLDALVQGEHAAHREQHHRHRERPEVSLSPVAERVLRCCRLAGTLAAEEQQQLVAGVGSRVDRLGQQARRPGDQETDELADRNPQVGEERREDRLAAAVGHPARVGQRSVRPNEASRAPRSPAQGPPVASPT